MNKQLILKLVFVAAILFAAFTIYSDEKEIERLTSNQTHFQKDSLQLADENASLKTQLDACCSHKDSLPPVARNGKYTDAQMDEMERKIRAHEGGQ